MSTQGVAISLFAIIFQGLNYGIDFRGGTEVAVEFESEASVSGVRNMLTEPFAGMPEVKLFGSNRELLIRTDAELSASEIRSVVLATFSEQLPDNPATILMVDNVGPRFAEDLRDAAFMAILFSLIVLFIYILIRFKKWYFSAGAVAALFHDVVIVLGVFTILAEFAPFDVTIGQSLIAAFLTIVGYSLNDTVVVFDRIRENSIIYKTMEFKKMINKSLNDTLSRTVITSVTTLFVVSVLFIFGGEVLKGFAFALVIGVVLGTYSSLFVASALVVLLEQRRVQAKS
jgi:preprotein translocase subunit SecF